jgi:hypothetical protein
LYYERPVKIVEAPDGGMQAWGLDLDSGGWVPANDLILRIVGATHEDIFTVTAEDFVNAVEDTRGQYLRGDGPVFALYETIESIVASAKGRRMTPEELALIKGLRRRTYRMFEEELRQRGDPAAEPDLLGA